MIQLLKFAEPISQYTQMFFDKRPEIAEKNVSSNYNYDANNQFTKNSVSLKKCLSTTKSIKIELHLSQIREAMWSNTY